MLDAIKSIKCCSLLCYSTCHLQRKQSISVESFCPCHVLQSFLKAQVVCVTNVYMVFELRQQISMKQACQLVQQRTQTIYAVL